MSAQKPTLVSVSFLGLRAVGLVFLPFAIEAATVDVQVRNFDFVPKVVNIRVGDTVRWIWVDGGHSVTSDGRFNSQIQGGGFTFAQTFHQPGQVPYYCIPHRSTGMTGTVNVAAASPPPAKVILNFGTMYAVDGPFVGDANPIRDVPGGGLPWQITKFAKGKLFADGRLVIQVKGLVFKDDPVVPPDKRGTNDQLTFRGLVSCLTEQEGQVVTRNLITDGFPATPSGKAVIKAKLELPNPCVAPIVMVLGETVDRWFAVTGFEKPQ
ncbi:MAG TPA: plastocyanin/azurin family copper-binding protein [Methylococcus sp.]|nr:plastocyanin/azurin family copper-binding protein [Methylococcus sp.]